MWWVGASVCGLSGGSLSLQDEVRPHRRVVADLVGIAGGAHAGAIERAQNDPCNEYYLAIEVNKQFVGFCRLGLNGVKAAKLGYAIRADDWGKGYATDAARTLAEFGFEALGLHRISAAMSPDNAAFAGVAKHLGMTYEGRIRDPGPRQSRD